MDVKPVTIELEIGYTDPKGTTHAKVTFGRRITGKELFIIDADPQSNIPTQYNSMLLRAKITEFGALTMPVPLKALLELDSLDRDDLTDAANRFSDQLLDVRDEAGELTGTRKVEFPDEKTVKLAFGYERNGLVYDAVEFGIRLTGMSEVEADNLGFTGIKRVCFLAAKQIKRLSQSDGESVLEAPFDAQFLVEILEGLDLIDIMAVRAGSEVWRNSFRRPGAGVSSDPRKNGTDPGNGNRMERAADSGAAI